MKKALYTGAGAAALAALSLGLAHHLQSSRKARALASERPVAADLAPRSSAPRPPAEALRAAGDQPQRTASVPTVAARGDQPQRTGDQPQRVGDQPQRVGDKPRKLGDQPQRTATAGSIPGFTSASGQFWPYPVGKSAEKLLLLYDEETLDVIGFAAPGERLDLLDLRGALAGYADATGAAPADGSVVPVQSIADSHDIGDRPWRAALRSTYAFFHPAGETRTGKPKARRMPPAQLDAVVQVVGSAPLDFKVCVRAGGEGVFDVVLRDREDVGVQAWTALSAEQLQRLARAYDWKIQR